MLNVFAVITCAKYSLGEFNRLPNVKKYLVALCRRAADIAEGLSQEALDYKIKSYFSTEESFKALEQDARSLAIELGYRSGIEGLDTYQHCHPLVMASYLGKTTYLEMASPYDYAWHSVDKIIDVMMYGTGYSLNRSERYEMLDIVAKRGDYNMLTNLWTWSPNNYHPELANAAENALKKLFGTSLDQYSCEELLNLDKKYIQRAIFKEVYESKLRELVEVP